MNINQYKLNEPKRLIKIESFTKRVIDNGLKREDLPELISMLEHFEHTYSFKHVYADYVALFEFLFVNQFHSFRQMQNGCYTYESLLKINDCLLEHFSWLFRVNRKKVDNDIYQYKYRVNRRLEKMQTAVEKLFNRYSCNLVVRVDLKYDVHKQHLVDIELFHEHVRKLCRRMADKDKCFKYLRFNAWCLEQAPQGSYHVHLFLIYNTSRRKHDLKLAKWVCNEWNDEITDGLGSSWNCNIKKNPNKDRSENFNETNLYDKNLRVAGYLCGLGRIYRNDPIGREKLKAAYSYLARYSDEKLDQRLRVRFQNMRVFNCSQV